MITKFRKLQDTWFAKTILILTGLSFVSLFGVAGYMGSVGKNKPVIKVDKYELLQGEILGQLEREVQMAKKLFGDNFEVSDTIRSTMLQNLVKRNLNNLITKNIARKNNISISDDLVRQVIQSQSDFAGYDGKFDINRMRQLLSMSGISEQQYIDSVKLDIIRQNIIQTPVKNFNTPEILSEYMDKINNQQRIFKYIVVDTPNLPIDREITEEEIEQYYQDFNANFIAPETRDISFIYLTHDTISNQTTISNEEAEQYYNDNSSQFETAETRNLVQMVFDDEKLALSALDELKSGKDFYAVAKNKAGQDKAITNLGDVAKDMMLEPLAEPVFAAKNGEIVGPIKTDMGWHILKVMNIITGKKIEKSTALAQIKENLKKEKMYDQTYELIAQIEDKIGSGEEFSSIAEQFNTPIHAIKNLEENGNAKSFDKNLKSIVSSVDFIDTAFSYNTGETSQVIEMDNGIAVLKIDEIYDSHPKDIKLVRNDIIKMWKSNERVAISQEITNDVVHDLENGDNINDIASRFKLKAQTTAPLTRQQSFAGISESDMKDLFLDRINTPHIINQNGKNIIIITDKIINPTNNNKKDEASVNQTKQDLTKEYADTLTSDFSSDYDVRIKYRLLGLAD